MSETIEIPFPEDKKESLRETSSDEKSPVNDYGDELEASTDSGGKSVDASVTHFEGFEDTYKDLVHIDSRVIEVGEDWIRFDCLIDKKNKIFEERTFFKEDLKNPESIEVGDYILIRKFRSPGKFKVTFDKGEKLVDKELFEDVSMFKELDNYDFSKKLND